MIARKQPMCRCGKKYKTRQAALNSPVGKAGGFVPEKQCSCGSFHASVRPYFEFPVIRKLVVRTVPVPRPRKPRVGTATGLIKPATGFSRAVKLAVRTRAGGGDADHAVCEACGIYLGRKRGQVQHVVARGMGGCDDPVIGSIANGALLCGTPQSGCHGLAERRDREMGDGGFWLPSGEDPRAVPMLLHSQRDRRSTHPRMSGVRLVWRSMDGRYLDEAPGLEAAA